MYDDLNKNFLGCRKAILSTIPLWHSPLYVGGIVAGGRWWWYPLDICFVGILSHYTVHSPPTVINFIFVKFWIMLYRIVWRRKQITLNFSQHDYPLLGLSSTRTANANTLRFSYPVTLRGTLVSVVGMQMKTLGASHPHYDYCNGSGEESGGPSSASTIFDFCQL